MWKVFGTVLGLASMVGAHAGLIATAHGQSPKELAQHVTLEDFEWHLGGFDTVLMLNSVRVKNGTDIPLKDFEIVCQTYAPSGTRLSKISHTLYDAVGANKTRTFRNVSIGFVNSQSKRVTCTVTRAKS